MSMNNLIAEVIGAMQMYYGEFVERRWGDLSSAKNYQAVAAAFSTVLSDLTEQDIQRGLLNMRNEQFLPTMPGFRILCLQGSSWFTPDQAWGIALELIANPQKTMKTTEQINRALKAVARIMDGEGQKAAARAFKDNYFDLVQRAKTRGEHQKIINRDAVLAVEHDSNLKAPTKQDQQKGMKNIQDIMQQFGVKPKAGA